MNRGLKRDGNGKTLSDWGRTRFSSFERTAGLIRARHFDAQVSVLARRTSRRPASAWKWWKSSLTPISKKSVRREIQVFASL